MEWTLEMLRPYLRIFVVTYCVLVEVVYEGAGGTARGRPAYALTVPHLLSGHSMAARLTGVLIRGSPPAHCCCCCPHLNKAAAAHIPRSSHTIVLVDQLVMTTNLKQQFKYLELVAASRNIINPSERHSRDQ